MIRNYLKIAYRFIVRNKLYSIINILGLSVGMACSILIFMWVVDEVKFDKNHDNSKLIYRVIMQKNDNGTIEKIARTPVPVGRVLKDEFPEIVNSTRFFFFDLGFYRDIEVYNTEGAFVDEDIFKMFDIDLIKGDTSSVFNSNYNIAISEKLANKIFKSTNVIGEDLRISQRTVFTISGVFKDVPYNSHLQFDFIIPYKALYEFGMSGENWDNYNNTHYTYVMLDETADNKDVDSKIEHLFKQHNSTVKATIFLQPFEDVYLKSGFSGDFENLGNSKNIYIFSIVSILLILIAGFNFMNLSTAQASARIKEIGVRKVHGAHRKGLFMQFLGEALLMVFIAHIVAVIMVELFLPVFNNLTLKELDLHYFTKQFIFLILSIIVFIGFFSGSYPALYLSGLSPLAIFRTGVSGRTEKGILRKTLVILQFAVSIALIIGSMVIMKQVSYLNNKYLGFEKENLIYVSLKGEGNRYELLKERLLTYPGIENVTPLSHELTDVVHMTTVTWEGKSSEDKVPMNLLFGDHDFLSTLKMKIKEGNDLKRMVDGDTIASFLINEQAANIIGLDNPIGKRFSAGGMDGYIVGIVKDFNFQPLYTNLKPMIITSMPRERYYLYMRYKGDARKVVNIIEQEFKDFAPDKPLEYYFLDDKISEMYRNDVRLSRLISVFTCIIVFISCLGLFGLISYVVERKTKEIGIRKALGSNNSRIVVLFSKEITIHLIIANVIAWPAVYVFAKQWLNNFSYRVDLDFSMFILSGIAAIIIALITLNLKVVKAACANPVESLRYE